MKTIHKYKIEIEDDFIRVPEGINVLKVDAQVEPGGRESIFLWGIVDTDAPMTDLAVKVIGTGHPISNNNLYHLGSVKMSTMPFVWHIFLDLNRFKIYEDDKVPQDQAI